MKISNSNLLGSLMAAAVCTWCASASAQNVVVSETTTTYAGTVTQYEPVGQMLVVRQESSPTPMTYSVTKATTFVDENGAPVAAERVTSGMPIVVHYTRRGDQMIASQVVVKRAVSVPAPVQKTTTVTTTTTTSGAGTVTQYVPGSPNLILRSETGPLTYSVSKTTTFVDDAGTPVAVESISPGVPVTVQYVQEGDRMVASRVVVVREKQRKLSEDEKDALKDLREAQREQKEKLKEKREDKDD